MSSLCNHNSDIVILCSNLSLWGNPYETEVRLSNNTFISSGILEIYFHNEWGNVCGEEFNKGAADSTCRQMGYTGSSSFSVHSDSSTPITWLPGASCNTSCSCFSSCFESAHLKNYTCEDTNFVHLTCIYDVSAYDMQPGSKGKCSKREGMCYQERHPSLQPGVVHVMVIGALVIALLVTATSVMLVLSTIRK